MCKKKEIAKQVLESQSPQDKTRGSGSSYSINIGAINGEYSAICEGGGGGCADNGNKPLTG